MLLRLQEKKLQAKEREMFDQWNSENNCRLLEAGMLGIQFIFPIDCLPHCFQDSCYLHVIRSPRTGAGVLDSAIIYCSVESIKMYILKKRIH